MWACGGVTSLTPVTSEPAACSERIAVSRPNTGPFVGHRPFCSLSRPLRAAASGGYLRAIGVDLREPLKPAPPADSHAITLPVVSRQREFDVLLKEVLMCACPIGMFRFFGLLRHESALGRRRALLLTRALPAGTTCIRPGPLRVRNRFSSSSTRERQPATVARIRDSSRSPADA